MKHLKSFQKPSFKGYLWYLESPNRTIKIVAKTALIVKKLFWKLAMTSTLEKKRRMTVKESWKINFCATLGQILETLRGNFLSMFSL
jgi:hypothetical protein